MAAPPAGPGSSASAAGLPGDLARFLARFEALDYGFKPLLLDLRAEILAIALDVADAVDHDVPGLPALRRQAQRVVDRYAIAVPAAHLGTHGRGGCTRLEAARKDLQAVGSELDQRVAVVVDQRMVEGVDEALPLLGSRAAPELTEHDARRSLGVEVRHEVLVDQRGDLGPVVAILVAVLVELVQHPLRSRLHQSRRPVRHRRCALRLHGRRRAHTDRRQQHAHDSHFFGSILPWLSVTWRSLSPLPLLAKLAKNL